jgi:protein associated with RNAse G/E
VELIAEKWGGRPHYRGPVHPLGDDEHGTWLWGPAGRTIHKGPGVSFVTEQDALILVAPGAWWQPAWWIGHPHLDLYVNINTPAQRDGDGIVTVDLDLDVVRWVDGRVEVLDRDEFEDHQARYGYPPGIVAAAEAATAEAHDLVARRRPPFDGEAARRWVARARRSFPR